MLAEWFDLANNFARLFTSTRLNVKSPAVDSILRFTVARKA
jgi:hypothetical protein